MGTKNRSFLSGLRHAVDGVAEGFRSERSMRIHCAAAMLVIAMGFLLGISAWEWIICVILIGLVIASELLNTALEHIVDILMPELNPRAKCVKDTAAGGVLIVSLAAAAAGLIIFVPKLWNLLF